MIKELKEKIKNEDTRNEIYKYLKAIQDLKVRGGQTEMHKVCCSIAEEFCRVNGFYDKEEVQNVCIDTINETDNDYIVEIYLDCERDEINFEVVINKQTMLITTVFGIDEYILY